MILKYSVFCLNYLLSLNSFQNLVHISDLLITLTLGFLLSFIHSQIVATSATSKATKSGRDQATLPRPEFLRTRAKRKRRSVRSRGVCTNPRTYLKVPEPKLGDGTGSETGTATRKRSVNWDASVPINLEPDARRLRRSPNRKGKRGEDDGFESLNGKSSSGEENMMNNQRRGALNSGPDEEKRDSKPNLYLNCQKMDSSDTEGFNCDKRELNIGGREGHSMDWIGVTTNSEEGSYSSDLNESDDEMEVESDFTPNVILNPSCGSTSCTVWENKKTKKAELSVLDISSAIIERADSISESGDYFYIGVILSFIISSVPVACRMYESWAVDLANTTTYLNVPVLLMENNLMEVNYTHLLDMGFGECGWERTVLLLDFVLKFCLTFLFMFLLVVAERTFKQRFLYAKLFSHITSSRRARKSDVPHFRLNKVRNIKTWLSVRSYLKRRGPQRSVDVIVSAAFILNLLLLAFLSVEWLKDSPNLRAQNNMEALIWFTALGMFLLRYMVLGSKINRKYRSISVIITEQINLYLQIEQKPNKKEELMVANSVLKLAADLLKELESPFKISGFSANPLLYTTVKIVMLSALSGVLSEILGFKLKLHKIKIK